MTKIDFDHRMAAHCENGVVSNLLRYYGIDLSEPMIFGIGSGIFFSHLPIIKLNGIPVTTFRPLPGLIFKRIRHSLGISTEIKRFRSPEKAMYELDNNLNHGIPTGMVIGVYHLPYFPAPYRFHFNAHNIIAFGKEDNKYLISDPIMETPQELTYDELIKVRYARGTYKPKGKMYYISKVPSEIDLKKAIIKGIKRTIFEMVLLPGPIIGVRGIRYLSSRIRKWPKRIGEEKASKYLGQVVRMQEEIGTGGAGFRFLYSAFLQEAAEILDNDRMLGLSQKMTEVGDQWREFAIMASRICKKRGQNEISFDSIADMVHGIADNEENVYRELRKAIRY